MLLLVSTLAQMEAARSEAQECWDTYFNDSETHYVKAVIFNGSYIVQFFDRNQIRESQAVPSWSDSSPGL